MGRDIQHSLLGLPCTNIHLLIDLRRIHTDDLKRMLLHQFDGERGLARCGRAHQADHVGFGGGRIHSEDCAGVIAHLIRLNEKQVPLSTLYLATDCEPVTQYELRGWLAAHLDVSLVEKYTKQRSSRRCSNKKLLDSGYRFIFPTYREGYLALIEQLKE